VGYAEAGPAAYHALLYSAGTVSDLGTLGGTLSVATGINNHGQIVGYAGNYGDSAFYDKAIIYSDGTMTDLNTLIDPGSGWTLQTANAINDNGQIVGYGINAAGQGHAYMLTPNPRLQNIRLAGGNASFELVGVTGLTYLVECTLTLSAANWNPVTNLVLASSPSLIVDASASASSRRFYRAVQIP
jgi:probable HAF family extracellular repeat protein